MSGWFEKVKSVVTGKKSADKERKMITTVNTAYEINLVPEVKMQMIKTQKMRNIVLFVCIIVSAVSIGAVVVLFGVKSGQDIAMASQDGKLKTMSERLLGYDELNDLVAIQGQLSGLSQLASNKKVLSRTFAALGVMMPTGGDSVQLSNLRVNLDENLLTLEGQADAKVSPYIDYRVLESYKKGTALTKYDYGRYVDVEGNEIPTWCISETDENGNAYVDGESFFAWWDLTKDGCAAKKKGETSEKSTNTAKNGSSNVKSDNKSDESDTADDEEKTEIALFYGDDAETVTEEIEDPTYVNEFGENERRQVVTRVKIWRTPQYDKWYRSGRMDLNGEISGIEHFKSECTTYSGVTVGDGAKWSSNNNCMLVPDGLDVVSSSNARDDSGNLVLKFSATMSLDSEFYMFKNKFMMAIGPMGQNVTDSYVQIQGMFAQEAVECDKNDADCVNNASNMGGN